MEDLLKVGVITTTHGVRGEVKVFPTTDPDRFLDLEYVLLDAGREMKKLEIRNVKFFKNLVILKFDGIDNINDVEKYKQCKLYVDREHAVALDEDEYFMTDLIGLTVEKEDGQVLGTLTEIIPTGANDVYVVAGEDKKEWLLPAIKECIMSVDIEHGRMVVHLMKGMEE